jgi:CO/xanthine dehydrogenase FAD-binding subunit
MGLTLQTFATVADASAALRGAADARYLGGGTLIVRRANEGDLSFSTLVRATEPSLATIAVADGRARIGASATMAAVVRHPDLAFLAGAARAVGGPAIRNMATVGGNLFAPVPYGDFAVALLALDATVGVGGAEVAIEPFLAGRHEAHAGAIVTAVGFGVPPAGAFRFLKAARVKPTGASVLSIAAVLSEAGGVIAAARIALGCMAERPIRARAAEAALVGRSRTKEGIAPALAAAREGTAPVTDAVASAWYRSEVLPVHLGRLLLG